MKTNLSFQSSESLDPPREHERHSRDLGVGTFLGPEEAAFVHDPWRDRNPTTRIAVGGEEVIEELPRRLYMIGVTDNDESHQEPPSEGR